MGAIGSILVDSLKEVYDILIIDYIRQASCLPDLPQGVELSNFDISSEDWPLLIRSEIKKCKYLFHLAGLTRNKESISFPHEYHKNNVQGTHNLLYFSAESKLDKFIFPSSIFSQGKFKDPYTTYQAVCELYCKMFSKIYGLNTLIVRIPKTNQPRSLKNISKSLIENATDSSTKPGDTVFFQKDKKS